MVKLVFYDNSPNLWSVLCKSVNPLRIILCIVDYLPFGIQKQVHVIYSLRTKNYVYSQYAESGEHFQIS